MSEFRVMGKLGLDGAGFFSTLNKASGAVNSFGSMLAGAFSVGAIAAFSKSVLDLAGKLNDVSEALALNVEFLQKFVNSSRKSGGSLEAVEKFLFETNKARQEALDNPNGKEAGAFAQLGFSTSQIQSATAQQLMEQIIKAFAGGAEAQDINALTEIGGRTAKKLVGGFKAGLDELTPIIKDDLAAALDEVGDKFTSLANMLKADFAPALGFVVDAVQNAVNKIKASGALFGGASANSMDVGDVATLALQGPLTLLAKRLMSDTATDAAASEIVGQNAEIERQKEIASAKRAASKSEQNAPANFSAKAGKEAKEAKEAKPYSDSRLAVGGFLGAGGNRIQNIAEQQLAVAREHLNVTRSLLTAVGAKGDTLIIGT